MTELALIKFKSYERMQVGVKGSNKKLSRLQIQSLKKTDVEQGKKYTSSGQPLDNNKTRYKKSSNYIFFGK